MSIRTQRKFEIQPKTEGHLLLHLDATQMALANNTNVTTWTDYSGRGFHTPKSGGTATYKTNQINGLGVIEFGGSNTYFTVPAGALSAMGATLGAEIFIVLRTSGSGGDHGLWTFTGASVAGDAAHYNYQLSNNIYENWGSNGRKTNPVGAGTGLTNWHMYNVASRTGHWSSRLDGAALASTGTNTFSMTSGFIGLSRANSDYYFIGGGQIAEVRIYDRVLGTVQRDIIEAQFAAKYGLAIA